MQRMEIIKKHYHTASYITQSDTMGIINEAAAVSYYV